MSDIDVQLNLLMQITSAINDQLVMLNRMVGPSAVLVGGYAIFEDIDGNLQIRAPDGSIIPLVRHT